MLLDVFLSYESGLSDVELLLQIHCLEYSIATPKQWTCQIHGIAIPSLFHQ
jgi:hypothetical protein